MIYMNEKQLYTEASIEVSPSQIEFKDLELFRAKITDDLADTLIMPPSTHFKKF